MMKKLLILNSFLLVAFIAAANTVVVRNIEELNAANKQARPGDTILLENGKWNDVTLLLSCDGTKEQPITFKAQTPGKVLITGHSQLKFGGNFIVVEGLYFTNGYGGDAVIDFRISKKQLANNCRLTNCVVDDFNNPGRMDENYWVSLSGKNNRIDHCSFLNKKNLGVLLAVILDDDRSRENFHSVDHNYFGVRAPLASNGGEIIRIGVSEHCQFYSNTRVTDNFFEHCDGETEIISVKSCGNVVRNNLFKECQGGVVLRHGNYNTVENNIFLGNDKEGTGGVRVINKGQWIVNNFFYRCRGVDFRSPLSVMNGIPNSPANRYVQVTDAVIANNTFYNCSSISFCEGSDTERTLPPQNVWLLNNCFYNTRDSIVYKSYDRINGFLFNNNNISREIKQSTENGFVRTSFATKKLDNTPIPHPANINSAKAPDSMQQVAQERLGHPLSPNPGFASLQLAKNIYANAYTKCGARWFGWSNHKNVSAVRSVPCKNAREIYEQLRTKEPVIIRLTADDYVFDRPMIISKKVRVIRARNNPVVFQSANMLSVFIVAGNGNLSLENLKIRGEGVRAINFISSDTNGSSNHYNLSVRNSVFENCSQKNGCRNFFHAYKSMVADSIVLVNNLFMNNEFNFFAMSEERDNKGYYNSEKIMIQQNSFINQNGSLVDIYRGGNDESTMGPLLIFTGNKLENCNEEKKQALVRLYGVQKSLIEHNRFFNCNPGAILIQYGDAVRAAHEFEENNFRRSGDIVTDKFVRAANNVTQ